VPFFLFYLAHPADGTEACFSFAAADIAAPSQLKTNEP
jgi:hypothetical protein